MKWLLCSHLMQVFAFRLSSEDSEEASAYFYDSDDSGETGVTAQHQGEMDLLGEILDTLSTHSSDQGKLSGAKSLDFFRSLDDIGYKATVSVQLSFEKQSHSLYSGILQLWNQQHEDRYYGIVFRIVSL